VSESVDKVLTRLETLGYLPVAEAVAVGGLV
jgi:hypothetical protein